MENNNEKAIKLRFAEKTTIIIALIFLFSLGPVIYFYKDSICYKNEDCKGWRADKYSVNDKYVEPHYCSNTVCYDGIVNFKHRDFYCNITYIKDVTESEASIAIQNIENTTLYRKDGLCYLSRKNIPTMYILILFIHYCFVLGIFIAACLLICAEHDSKENFRDDVFDREVTRSARRGGITRSDSF